MTVADDVMASILARTRLEIGDYDEGFYVATTTDGISSRYELGLGVLDTYTVVVNGVTQDPATAYTADTMRGIIIFTAPPAAGLPISVSGNHHQFFTDTQLTVFASSALLKHTYGSMITSPSVDAFGHHQFARVATSLVSLPPIEYSMVAYLTAYEALQALAADASYDIDVTTAEGTALPRSERFANIQALAASKLDMYKEISGQFNVGLYRVVMSTLRRVSRTTNRLTPVYIPREYDDNAPPTRELVHTDVNPSLARADEGVFSADLIVRAGTGLVTEVDTGINITGATLVATVTTGGFLTSVVTLGTVVINAALGKVSVTITQAQASLLPAFSEWRLVATMPDTSTPTIAAGTVVVEDAP